MEKTEHDPPLTTDPPRPRTLTVLALLMGTSLIFSYLAAYALTNALTGAGVLSPWTPGHDPRPQRMLACFITLLSLFALVASGFRWLSARQLKSIDRMEEDE